jgi:hypothetical protein
MRKSVTQPCGITPQEIGQILFACETLLSREMQLQNVQVQYVFKFEFHRSAISIFKGAVSIGYTYHNTSNPSCITYPNFLSSGVVVLC